MPFGHTKALLSRLKLHFSCLARHILTFKLETNLQPPALRIPSPDIRAGPRRPQPGDHSRKRPYVAGVSETSSHRVVSARNFALVRRASLSTRSLSMKPDG